MDWATGCQEVAHLLNRWRPDAKYVDVCHSNNVVYFDLYIPEYPSNSPQYHWLMTNIKINLYLFYQRIVQFAYFLDDYERDGLPRRNMSTIHS